VPRANYADLGQGFKSFENAMREGFGANGEKLEQDWYASVEDLRRELRVWRWDLSRNIPPEPAEFDRLIGAIAGSAPSRSAQRW
jgi:hypothetical protein